jgi:hypothetical protein
MQHEQHDYEDDDLAVIWRSAQHRRSEDIYSWFTDFLERQRQRDFRPRYLRRRVAAFVWKLLEATHAVSRTTN